MLKTGQHILSLCLFGLAAAMLISERAEAQGTIQPVSSAIKIEELPTPARTTPITAETNQKVSHSDELGTPQITMEETPKIASLSFAWNMPVNLAVFKRQHKLWIVFDHPQKINIADLRTAVGPLAKNIFQFPHPSATIIQMTPEENVKVTVRKEGLLWIVDLSTDDMPKHPVKDMTVFTQYDSLDHAYLFIPTENSGNIVPVIDPDVGDIITIAPTADIGLGASQPYRYPEFDMLATEQGLAYVIKAPDIQLTRSNSGLLLRAANRGLAITQDLESIKRREMFKNNDDSLQGFDLSVAPQLLAMKYEDALNQIKSEIIAAEADLKNKTRLELVKFYLAKGLGTNALYILNQMEKAKIPESNNDKFHALKGVANFLTHRYEQAAQEFEHGLLPEINEAVFWRTLARSAQEYHPENNVILFSYLSQIRAYPNEIRNQIATIGAETALQAGDDLAAQNFIDLLKSDEERLKNRAAQIRYYSAKKVELQGYPRNAVMEYREIAKMNDAKYSALARYDNVSLSQQIGVMPLKAAISELEKLRFAWGEKEFKWKLMDKLSRFYLKDGDYYRSLKTMQEMMAFASDERKAPLQERMVNIFEDIYINNQADTKMSALKSLALYRDFEWLARLSTHYTQIIRKLADRLVAVDLLPRAEKLLNELLKNGRLTAEERGQIGARIAVISLFENRSPDALDVLEATEAPDLSAALAAQRRVIKAKALANSNQIDEALELLSDDNSKNATLLKADIFWNGHQWDKASDTIKYLIEKPIPDQPLSAEQIGYILDWATALKQAGRETVLVRLRNKFMPYFEKTKYQSAFNILTNHLEPDKVDLREINNVVNDVQAFSNFAKAYNDTLKNGDTDK